MKNIFNPNELTFELADSIKIEGNRILELGTSRGFLLERLLEKDSKKTYIGIDINFNALKSAVQKEKITYINTDIEYIDKVFKKKLDIIIINPPFYEADQGKISLNKDKFLRNIGKGFSINVLFNRVSRILSQTGKFYIVHLCNNFFEIYGYCLRYDFYLKKIQFIYTKRNNPAKYFIAKIQKRKCKTEFSEPIYLRSYDE